MMSEVFDDRTIAPARSLEILGLGTALPSYAISQQEAAALACTYAGENPGHKRVIDRLYAKTDINKRHAVLVQSEFYAPPSNPCTNDETDGPTTRARMEKYETSVIPLAVQSASRAIERSGVRPEQITHLISITCTGFFAPGFDIALIKQLQLDPGVSRFQLGFMGCHGALNGLNLARLVAAACPQANILLCAAELSSIHYQYGWNLDNLLANSLFADGSAAMVLRSCTKSESFGCPPLSRVIASGSCLLCDSEEAMTWRIGDNGFVMTISSRVPELIRAELFPWLSGWLRSHNLTVDEVQSWAVHPGGPKILDAVEESLNLNSEALAVSRQVLSECGNMSSPTVLFILEKLREKEANGPCVILGFGPGLMVEATLVV